MKDKKQKPTKDSFIKYYILWPIQNFIESIAIFFKKIWRRITGAWWCEHCETYHGRRVHRFYWNDWKAQQYLARTEHMICSLGRDARKWDTNVSPIKDLRTAKAKIEARVKSTHDYPPNIFPTPDKPCPGYNDEDLAN